MLLLVNLVSAFLLDVKGTKKLRRKILLDEVNSILHKIRTTKDIVKDEQPKWDDLELKLSKDLQEKIRKAKEI